MFLRAGYIKCVGLMVQLSFSVKRDPGPEDVQTQQNHQQAVKEVISEERRVQGHGIHPCTIHDPERQTETHEKHTKPSKTSH